MSPGEKRSFTDKEKRQAAHIEAGYEKKGVNVKKRKLVLVLPSTNSPTEADNGFGRDLKRLITLPAFT
jgi:hypothetical protein